MHKHLMERARAACSAAFVGLAFMSAGAAHAQGLDAKGALETIIDAPVQTEEKPLAQEQARLLAAIARSAENATQVRKLFDVAKVDIVLVPDAGKDGTPVKPEIEKHKAAIEELHKAIEGSAIFFHALDSRQILLRDVVAVEFGRGDAVTIFAAAKILQN